MIRLLCLIDVPSWCFASRAESLRKYAPPDFEVLIHEWTKPPFPEHDIVFLIDGIVASRFSDKPHVASWNSDPHRRFDRLPRTYEACDYLVMNCKATWEAFGRRERTAAISNGVDTDIFRPLVPIEQREHRVFWTGSSNPAKGKGWEILQAARPELERRGFLCDFHPVESAAKKPFSQAEMVDAYNRSSYVLCCSASDSTPNTSLEGMACGCVLVSTNVGNVCEFGIAHQNYVPMWRDAECLMFGLEFARGARERLSAAGVATMQQWSYGEPGNRATVFFDLFRAIARGERPAAFSYDEYRI